MTGARIEMFGCPIDVVTMDETVERIHASIRQGRSIQHGVVDAGKLALMQHDPSLYESVTSSDLINAEGQLLIWLSRLHGTPLPERVVGLELFEKLVALAAREGYGVYLLGARPEVVERVARIFERRHGPGVVVGHRDGYFSEDEADQVAAEIARSGARLLFVGIRSPKKEEFLHRHGHQLGSVVFRMGVGGSFDVVAGRVKRAPRWMQRACLEWFYRFLQEPRDKWKVEVVDSFDFLWLYLRHLRQGLAGRRS